MLNNIVFFRNIFMMSFMKILVLSDVHGNTDALKKVLESVSDWDEIWVLGDLVDYGPDPDETIDIIRSLDPEIVLQGNHDHAVAYGVDCRCGEKTHDLSVYTRMNISMKKLSKEQISWLRSLSPRRDIRIKDHDMILVHGSPRNPLYDYLHPDLPREKIIEMLTSPSIRLSSSKKMKIFNGIIVAGHTHIPTDLVIEGVRILNPGSVGQPRDGDPRASAGLLDVENMIFKIIRVEYDIENVLRKLRTLIHDHNIYERLAKILLRGEV